MRSALMDMGAKNRHLSLFRRVTLRKKLHGSPARTSMRPLSSGSGNGSLGREMKIKEKRKDRKDGFCPFAFLSSTRTVSQSHDSKSREPGTAQSRPNVSYIAWTCPLAQAPTLQPEPTRTTRLAKPRHPGSHSLVVLGALAFPPLLWCHPFRFPLKRPAQAANQRPPHQVCRQAWMIDDIVPSVRTGA